MTIHIVDHALLRMKQRGITRAEIRKVLGSPEIRYPSKAKGRELFVKEISGRKITVCARVRKRRTVVVSVWSDENGG
jgi:hypothetical protein